MAVLRLQSTCLPEGYNPLSSACRQNVYSCVFPDVKCEFLLSGIGSDSPPTSTVTSKMQYFELSERTVSKASVTIGEAVHPSFHLLLSPYPLGNTKTLDEEFGRSPISSLG